MHIPNPTIFKYTLIALFILAILFYLYIKYRISKKPEISSENLLKKSSKPPKKSSEIYKEALILISQSNRVIFSNRTASEMLGLPQEFQEDDLAKAKLFKISDGELVDIYTILEMYKYYIQEQEEYIFHATLIDDKNEIDIKIFLALSDKLKPHYIIALSDLSNEREISSFKHKDLITQLPNQNRAIEDISFVISKIKSQGRPFGLILISLDNFTELRAMAGYHRSDDLIVTMSETLQNIAMAFDSSVYHMMRNNFLLMVPDINNSQEVNMVVDRINTCLAKLLSYSNARIYMTFSTGVSFFPKSGNSAEILIDSAYKALSEAMGHGGGYIVLDEEGLFHKNKANEMELYNEIHDALENNEFELYYQPLVSLESGEVFGAEALIRWNHPTRGLVNPSEFIPIAEKTGLIIALGRFVIDEAIKQQKKWEIFDYDKLQISINVSLREIETGGVVSYITKLLNRYKVTPSLIKFEITENIAMVNPEITKQEFDALKEWGVELALDDYGTGYSSFEYLKDFSVDNLKIDQSFVTDMVHNQKHQKIVRAMIDLGHNLDIKITAEGIEDKATYDMLKELGCDIAQGFYLSKPLSVSEFQKLIS